MWELFHLERTRETKCHPKITMAEAKYLPKKMMMEVKCYPKKMIAEAKCNPKKMMTVVNIMTEARCHPEMMTSHPEKKMTETMLVREEDGGGNGTEGLHYFDDYFDNVSPHTNS